jgi:hypothetical protein
VINIIIQNRDTGCYKYEEVPTEKVVPLYKPFTTILYLKKFKPGKVLFGAVKV